MQNSLFSAHEISPWYLTIAFLLVLLNAFFVAAEFAMVKVRSTRLETLQESGNFLARWAYSIVQNLNAYLSATQLGITLASLGLGWVGEPAFAALIEPLLRNFALSEVTIRGLSFTVAFTVITVLHLVLGELVPKQMAIQTAEKVLLAVAVPMRFFYWVFFPFLWFLNHSTNAIVRLLGFEMKPGEETHTEDEIRLIVEDSYEEGSLSPRKASLLENIFEFTHRTARQIMVPRQDIVSLQLGRSAQENLQTAKESGHTRFPLCDGDLDHVIGLINVKDIIWELEDSDNLINLYDLKRPILFVPESMTSDQLLREFQTKKIHMAIVINEFGTTAGLVSLEDVIEELVGEIQDEFDQELPKISKRGENSYLVDGTAGLREVEQVLDLALEDESSVSVGGFFVNRLGRLAREGDFIRIPPYRISALEVKNRRVLKLLFEKFDTEVSAASGE
ncbi:MAG: hemolysin family protein [bacterium]